MTQTEQAQLPTYEHEGVRRLLIAMLDNAVNDVKGKAVGAPGKYSGLAREAWKLGAARDAISWLRGSGLVAFRYAGIGVQPARFKAWIDEQEARWNKIDPLYSEHS